MCRPHLLPSPPLTPLPPPWKHARPSVCCQEHLWQRARCQTSDGTSSRNCRCDTRAHLWSQKKTPWFTAARRSPAGCRQLLGHLESPRQWVERYRSCVCVWTLSLVRERLGRHVCSGCLSVLQRASGTFYSIIMCIVDRKAAQCDRVAQLLIWRAAFRQPTCSLSPWPSCGSESNGLHVAVRCLKTQHQRWVHTKYWLWGWDNVIISEGYWYGHLIYDYNTCFCDKSTTSLRSVASKLWSNERPKVFTDFAFFTHLTIKFVSFTHKFPKEIKKAKQYLYTLHEQNRRQKHLYYLLLSLEQHRILYIQVVSPFFVCLFFPQMKL